MQGINPLVWMIVAVVVIALLVIWYMMARRRTANLRNRFGDEYDRTVDHVGHTGKAEAALEERERRVAQLDIRPLTAAERDTFSHEWHDIKAVFVESPAEAVLHADRMLPKVMKAKGFPMGDFDRRYEDLTVDHGEVARHYRAGRDLAERQNRGEASTEDLRQAMIHYEALFDELVADVADDRDLDRRDDGPVTSSRPVSSRPVSSRAQPVD
ncbi:hypothetical protein [Croceicoccus naphthovorans]|uniref:hypothetical protein n=1 Tax=Croceicoccus naphthovorans TaxID=1348774 RepID=UPI00069D0FC6|nr:hypothetical protein [Croceicoccus naphthovorans]MBB3991088.1 hypothetical protein [Croceicoccus naphthovorans]